MAFQDIVKVLPPASQRQSLRLWRHSASLLHIFGRQQTKPGLTCVGVAQLSELRCSRTLRHADFGNGLRGSTPPQWGMLSQSWSPGVHWICAVLLHDRPGQNCRQQLGCCHPLPLISWHDVGDRIPTGLGVMTPAGGLRWDGWAGLELVRQGPV